MESPGYLIGVAFVLLAVVLIVVTVKAATRKRRARRTTSLAEALAASGHSVQVDVEIPADAPDWEIAPRNKRVRQAIAIERGDTTAYLFDHVHNGKGYPGWNKEVTSGGESSSTTTYRHTLCCVHAPALSLPSIQVIPSLREKMGEIVGAASGGLRAEGHDKSAGALDMVMGLVGGMVTARERPGALTLVDQPELTAGFRIYGEDEPVVAKLVAGPLRDLLLSWPGTILEGQGAWLIVSFNVGLTFGNDKTSRLGTGLLSPEQTAHLVEFALDLHGALT